MKPKTAILLTVILLLVVGFIVVKHGDVLKPASPDKTATDAKRLWSGPVEDVQQVTIVSDDGEAIRFVWNGSDWHIAEPIEARAWAYMVEGIAQPLSKAEPEQVYSPDDPNAPGANLTGLDKPRWTVSLTDGDGVEHTLKIGRPVPASAGQKTYVRPAGSDRTYVVKINLADKLARPLIDYRNRIVVEVDQKKIGRIRIEGQEITELHKQDGVWRIVKPIFTTVDLNNVDKLLRKLSRFKVKSFLDDKPKSLDAYGLEPGKERLVIRYWMEDEQPATEPATEPTGERVSYAIALGNKKYTQGERYAKLLGSPEVFLVRVSTIEDLQPPLLDLRDKSICPIESENVMRVELDLPQGKAQLVNRDGNWHVAEPFEGKANDGLVENLLETINILRADGFRDDATVLSGFGLDPAGATITIHQAGKSDKLVLQLGTETPSGEMTFVKRATDGAIALVKTDSLRSVLSDPARYWDSMLWQMPAGGEVTELRMRRADGDFLLSRKNGEWTMSAPVEGAVDVDNLNSLLDTLEKLQASQILSVSQALPEKYAKASSRINVTISGVLAGAADSAEAETQATESGKKAWTVSIRVAKIDGLVYIWRGGAEPVAVGRMSPNFFESLFTELRERTVWKIEPNEIDSIRLVAGSETLELKREGRVWKYPADPYVKINAWKVRQYLNSIEELTAERFFTHRLPNDSDIKHYALTQPWFTLRLAGSQGQDHRIIVSPMGSDRTRNRYATIAAMPGVFVLSSEDAGKMVKTLDDIKE